MKKEIVFFPQNVCSREYHITVEDGIITSAEIIGGCQGNLTGIAQLIVGMKAEDVISRLEGIKCRGSRTRETSCPDQISKALKQNL